jgi:hypothetical protein
MEFRKANGEQIGPESPLHDIFAYRYGKKTANDPQKLTTDSIGRIIEQGLKEGIRQPLTNGVKHHEFQSAHGLRKYYTTTAEQAGMNGINIEILMGHDLGISEHYARPTDQAPLRDYLKAVDSLTISNNKQMVIKVSETQQQTNGDKSIRNQTSIFLFISATSTSLYNVVYTDYIAGSDWGWDIDCFRCFSLK